MYVATIPNRNSPPAILLRESYREEGKVNTRTLANISCLPDQSVELLRRSLKGEKFVSAQDAFEIIEDGSPAHGHVDAVLAAMRRLGFSRLICSKIHAIEIWSSPWLLLVFLNQSQKMQLRFGGPTLHCLRPWASKMLTKTISMKPWIGS